MSGLHHGDRVLTGIWRFCSVCLLSFVPSLGQADVHVCNDTDVLQVMAVGHDQDGLLVSQGWWALRAGRCVLAVAGDASGKAVFLSLKSAPVQDAQNGMPLCTTPQPFRISNSAECAAFGYDSELFHLIAPVSDDTDRHINLSEFTKADATLKDRDAMMALLQGEWVSTDDAATRIAIEGTQRIETYGDQITGTEDIDIVADCQGSGAGGPFLRSVEPGSGDVTCYSIETLTANDLVLSHLPRGNFLAYQKSK